MSPISGLIKSGGNCHCCRKLRISSLARRFTPFIWRWQLPGLGGERSCILSSTFSWSLSALDKEVLRVTYVVRTMTGNGFLSPGKWIWPIRKILWVMFTWGNKSFPGHIFLVFLKVSLFLNFLSFFFFFATLHGMWDLSSPTRNQTQTPCKLHPDDVNPNFWR